MCAYGATATLKIQVFNAYTADRCGSSVFVERNTTGRNGSSFRVFVVSLRAESGGGVGRIGTPAVVSMINGCVIDTSALVARVHQKKKKLARYELRAC